MVTQLTKSDGWAEKIRGQSAFATLLRTGAKVDKLYKMKDFPRPVTVGKDTKVSVPDMKDLKEAD